jgi:hypothetical protein
VTVAAKGDRVRLVRTTETRTRLQPGTEGTVIGVDAIGTVHVAWDDGSTLGLVEEEWDRFEVISEGSGQ